jgi:hypothetical protein
MVGAREFSTILAAMAPAHHYFAVRLEADLPESDCA